MNISDNNLFCVGHWSLCLLIIVSSTEAPAGDEEQDMFTTFRKHNGEEYTVYSKDGKRYYVDWETQVRYSV